MEKIRKAPIIFKPYLKTVVWGGNKICEFKGISQQQPNIGESWEISPVSPHETVVEEGCYKGLNISDLIERFGSQFLGEKVIEKFGNKFPLLIKLIDARDNLSIQVHPDDELAKKRQGGSGKTEMWYVISAEKGSKIYAGWKEKINPEDFVKKVKDGTFVEAVQDYESKSGDVYYLPPGKVHAIGAGNFLAEIQQASDITYRIYDYDRKDADGNKRELHVEEAKEAIDFSLGQACKMLNVFSEKDEGILVDCDHFTTRKLIIKGTRKIKKDTGSFIVVICLSGEIDLDCEEGKVRLKKGETGLLPAVIEDFKVYGDGEILTTKI